LPTPSIFSYFYKVLYSFLGEVNRQYISTYEITITEVPIIANLMNTNDHPQYNYLISKRLKATIQFYKQEQTQFENNCHPQTRTQIKVQDYFVMSPSN
jgi:hypothetical protein